MEQIHRWHITLAVIALLGGCGKGEAEVPPYPVLDSGFPARSNDNLYWLDNDRVIFVSYGPKPKSVADAENDSRVPSINIWDTQTNRVEFYAKGSHLCYSDGHIKYMPVETVVDDPEKSVKVFWREGPLEQPELKVFRFKTEEEYREWFRAHVDNPHTCRWEERPEFARERWLVPLRKGDGWLVTDQQKREWKWHRNEVEIVRTGIRDNGVGLWLEYANAYFFQHVPSGDHILKTDCIRHWWLKPDGTIKTGCEDIRTVKKIDPKRSVALYPSRVGMLFGAGRTEDYSSGTAGIYRLSHDAPIRIMKGGLEQSTLSPDGCKLAYTHVPFFEARGVGAPGEVVLKSVNLCQRPGAQPWMPRTRPKSRRRACPRNC